MHARKLPRWVIRVRNRGSPANLPTHMQGGVWEWNTFPIPILGTMYALGTHPRWACIWNVKLRSLSSSSNCCQLTTISFFPQRSPPSPVLLRSFDSDTVGCQSHLTLNFPPGQHQSDINPSRCPHLRSLGPPCPKPLEATLLTTISTMTSYVVYASRQVSTHTHAD